MSSDFIRKLFEHDRETRASIASYRTASIGFAFASIANLFVIVIGLSMEPIVVDLLRPEFTRHFYVNSGQLEAVIV